MRNKILIVLVIIFSWTFWTDQSQAAEKSREEYEKIGNIIWETYTKKKMVAITFDDGPHSRYTPQILDILAKYKAKSTFFVIGSHALKHPDLIKRQIKEGHEIANHTYNHFSKRDNLLHGELKRTSDIIYDLTGVRPSLFRPVGGAYNDVVIKTAQNTDHFVVMWSWHQDTYDWKKPGVNKIVNKVTSNISPGDIILMHDAGGNRTQTVKALDKILNYLTKNGYQVVTVSELLYQSDSIFPNFIEKEFKDSKKQLSSP